MKNLQFYPISKVKLIALELLMLGYCRIIKASKTGITGRRIASTRLSLYEVGRAMVMICSIQNLS